jgi:hypothetical protein
MCFVRIKFLYYFGLFMLTVLMLYSYIDSEPSIKWFKISYTYSISAGIYTFIGDTHFVVLLDDDNIFIFTVSVPVS